MSSATLSLERSFDAPPRGRLRSLDRPRGAAPLVGGGPDWDTPEAEVDLRVGGGYRLAMRDPGSGDVHVVAGEYTEVVPPERLAYTWTWEHDSPGSAGSIVTVLFRDDGHPDHGPAHPHRLHRARRGRPP